MLECDHELLILEEAGILPDHIDVIIYDPFAYPHSIHFFFCSVRTAHSMGGAWRRYVSKLGVRL